jgi:hypothetical protein
MKAYSAELGAALTRRNTVGATALTVRGESRVYPNPLGSGKRKPQVIVRIRVVGALQLPC